MSTSTQGTGLSISGASGSFGIALGGAVNEDLIIYATFIDSVIGSPTSKSSTMVPINGKVASRVGGGSSGAGMAGIGLGAAHYLDSNLFFAGSLLGSWLFADDSLGERAYSRAGITFEGLFGKEWWVSDNWGLGLTGQVLLGVMKDQAFGGTGSPPTWELAAFSVLFSATYN
jgi:hypothetical protein